MSHYKHWSTVAAILFLLIEVYGYHHLNHRHHRKVHRGTRSHNHNNIPFNNTRNHHRHKYGFDGTTISPLLENKLLETLESKIHSSKDLIKPSHQKHYKPNLISTVHTTLMEEEEIPTHKLSNQKTSISNSVLSGLDDKELNKERAKMFVSPNCSVVLAQTGSTAAMHCEVTEMGENTVTWIRRRDYHLLTVGLTTYSSDDRFFTAHGKNAQDFALHVRFAKESDGGLYECQMSSHPPTSLFVELRLVEAVADIVGGPDKIVKSGSPLRLNCLLRRSTEPPMYVFWYHEQKMINFDSGGGVMVRHGRQSSELVIAQAEKHHAGNYSCVPSNAKPASVNVHILQSEKPAAMQHGSKSAANLKLNLNGLLIAAITLTSLIVR